MIESQDRSILRELAQRLAEIGHLPVMAQRRDLWTRHNQLQRTRPLVLVFPEGSWEELLPWASMRCQGDRARAIEWNLRSRIYTYEHFMDDTVIEPHYVVHKAVEVSGWGLESKEKPSTETRGAWAFVPVIHEPKDLERLQLPKVSHDAERTQHDLKEAQDLFGDILEVKLKGVDHISFHFMAIYTRLRGLEEVMWDMHDRPQMVHDAMAILEEGYRGIVQQYIDLNVLSLNNDDTYHSSGGVGYTSELPAPGFDPERVRPCDMWASAESQEMAEVSPAMHAEFVLPYEKRVLEPFGLNGYGCCEDLCAKLGDVFTIPNLRRISVSPFADVSRCAEQIQDKYIFSWKAHPAHLVGEFDGEKIFHYLRDGLEASADCIVEVVLKDTHTCDNHPERFRHWTAIAREVVNRF